MAKHILSYLYPTTAAKFPAQCYEQSYPPLNRHLTITVPPGMPEPPKHRYSRRRSCHSTRRCPCPSHTNNSIFIVLILLIGVIVFVYVLGITAV
jgi:hypothetical protein